MKSSYYALNLATYNKLSRFIASRYGKPFLALWAFLEASFWFIAPDFLLVIYGALLPKEKWRFVLTAFVASFLGGAVYFILNLVAYDTMAAILKHTPFVNDEMFRFIRALYATEGLAGVLHQPFSFISFKIWTHLAVEANFSVFAYLPLVMLARSVRFGLKVTVGSLLGSIFRNSLKRHFVLILIAFSFSFIMTLLVME